MPINAEKQKIIEQDGNVLVTANPGTGKTDLLAYKYTYLIKKGIEPEQILCLTFTEKAKKEMENRIVKILKEQNFSLDISKLKVFTFHSYALDNIEENGILSTNLLRCTILRYIKDKKILNYSDEYLIDNIVPKMENLMRYLKSFGITPYKIDIAEAKNFLNDGKKYNKEEIEQFAEYFVDIFRSYEELKNKRGIDYADMLLKFIELKNKNIFDYVLVDELQDVNMMEADVAIMSCRNFFVVGDKKQAIFGFQGGSIINFRKFENSEKFILSENFRSTNEILNYAKNYFVSKTKDISHKEELKNLYNARSKTGQKPAIYEVDKNKIYAVACELVGNLDGKTAIVVRTNSQITRLAGELKSRGINFGSTFLSSSGDAKKYIINFIKGILSSDVQDVKNAMFTPFFPCSLREAFEISSVKKVSIEDIYEKIPAFMELRKDIKNADDINILFRERIIPMCIIHGEEYLSAGMAIHSAYQEALFTLDDKSLESMVAYLESTELPSMDSDIERRLTLTTVHKAKGMQFDNVIYIPSKSKNNGDFMDNIVKGILKSKGIDVEEELEEEDLRVDFVAFTRAKNKLFILTDKINDYLNDYGELNDVHIDIGKSRASDLNESVKRAFNLFVNKKFDEAKALLNSNNKDKWINDFVRNYFESLEGLSFSSLPDKAYNYFVYEILKIKEKNDAVSLGSEVHNAARQILSGEEYFPSEDTEPFVENILKLIEEIKKSYPEIVAVELKLELPLNHLGFDSNLKFKSSIDAIFKNKDNYLIADWKTDKDINNASKHRQQLEIYKRIFSIKKGVDLKNIKVAIGYAGLRSIINTGKINYELDMKQPVSSTFETISKRINMLLSWIKTPEKFFDDFIKEDVDDMLWRSVAEEFNKK